MEERSQALHVLEISLMMTPWGSKHVAEWIITYNFNFKFTPCIITISYFY